MSLIAGDYCDYNMGDYDCSDGFYGYEVEGDCGGYENSHDQNLGRFESYDFEGENKVNEVPSAYGNFGDDVGPRDGSYDDVGACEKSYTSYSKPSLVLGITLLFAKLMKGLMRVHVRSKKIHILHLVVLLIKIDIV